ncbi:MAG: hypothetical protein HQK75_08275 [Candidatus Magnetomorum sp.]|nr:hypothetical protein [Candidatus Magnetomorum sp.]
MSSMFHINSGAKNYSKDDYLTWLKSAGFVDCLSHDVMPGVILVTGRKE